MTNLIRCDKGHFYDSEQYGACPYCTSAGGQPSAAVNGGTVGPTMPVQPSSGAQGGDIGKTMPVGAVPGNGSTVALGQVNKKPSTEEDSVTVAVIRDRVRNGDDVGVNPVVGWLVCVEGREMGRDYRVFAGNNFIGRGDNMDICIRGDETISRSKHACISYDDKQNKFYVYQGDSRGLVYVNEEIVLVPRPLQPYDLIELGKTKLRFVPFCSEQFKWE